MYAVSEKKKKNNRNKTLFQDKDETECSPRMEDDAPDPPLPPLPPTLSKIIEKASRSKEVAAKEPDVSTLVSIIVSVICGSHASSVLYCIVLPWSWLCRARRVKPSSVLPTAQMRVDQWTTQKKNLKWESTWLSNPSVTYEDHIWKLTQCGIINFTIFLTLQGSSAKAKLQGNQSAKEVQPVTGKEKGPEVST